MMRHWVLFPSADPRRGLRCADQWLAKGYEVLVGLDGDKLCAEREEGPKLICMPAPFPGYYRVINGLAKTAFDHGADLVTAIGDDMDPPSQGAQAIAELYFGRFKDGFGVLQGCGDRQGDVIVGTANSERICGSPTFGRGWHERGYAGRGPFWEEYRTFYGDEDLWNVAKLCGVLWLEKSITIFHRHWSFGHAPKMWYQERNQENWQGDCYTFERRKREGFPGWQPKTLETT